MKPRRLRRIVLTVIGLALVGAFALWTTGFFEPRHVFEVFPGSDIQAALEAAARVRGYRNVRVHAGTYRPASPGEALIYFNARHDGICLEAADGGGDVVLTAANSELALAGSSSFPAVVNHVVYFGDGISRATKIRGFKITGARGFVSGPADLERVRTREDLEKSSKYRSHAASPIESNDRLRKTQYFYTDGGGILVSGRSFPTIEGVEIFDNEVTVCAGGVSIQHSQGELHDSVLFKDCVFRDNRAAVSGSAVDLLTPNSWAVFENCLFVGNLSNTSIDANGGLGYAALTVMPGSRATVQGCTFTGNRNGADDRGSGSTYADTIFWRNDRPGGASAVAERFELGISSAEGVTNCWIGGSEQGDILGNISSSRNRLGCPDPEFDSRFAPRNTAFDRVGYRPRR